MDYNFLVLLFKNKTKQKIINKYRTKKRALELYNKLIEESNNVVFDTGYENGIRCEYEIALVHKGKSDRPLFVTDFMGRNIKIETDDDSHTIIKIEPYKKEELIHDYKTKERIPFGVWEKRFLGQSGLKMISKLNNKIVFQLDDKIRLFALKNDDDAKRFLEILEDRLIKLKRTDCLIVRDISTIHRKYLYEQLVEEGYPKSYLFRHSTTHPTKK
jgi:hypothetical protein